MYNPPHSQKMSDLDTYQIRLGLQGATKTGKTYSALTFPNPVVIDLDTGLVGHKHREDIIRLPFCDNEWIKTWFKYDANAIKHPQRDAVMEWLKTEGRKLEKDQTLILDSWTTLQDAFDQQSDATVEPARYRTATGGTDERGFWAYKIEYSRDICVLLKSLCCHVVVTFHEQDTRNASGQLIGKIEALMQGKFQKKLGLYFTDYFRCICKAKVDSADKTKIIGADYFWQTKGDNEVNLGSRLKDCPQFTEPNYNIFKQYFTPAK